MADTVGQPVSVQGADPRLVKSRNPPTVPAAAPLSTMLTARWADVQRGARLPGGEVATGGAVLTGAELAGAVDGPAGDLVGSGGALVDGEELAATPVDATGTVVAAVVADAWAAHAPTVSTQPMAARKGRTRRLPVIVIAGFLPDFVPTSPCMTTLSGTQLDLFRGI
jgi:hypothetical protein